MYKYKNYIYFDRVRWGGKGLRNCYPKSDVVALSIIVIFFYGALNVRYFRICHLMGTKITRNISEEKDKRRK